MAWNDYWVSYCTFNNLFTMTIGIPGWMVGPNSFGVGLSYVEFCKYRLECDDFRILNPNSPIYTDLDLLILPGGADVNPLRYDEVPSFHTDKPDLLKEYFDVHVLPDYIRHEVPVFGICRGIQTLAVHFGGKLIQDMDHETNKAENPYEGVHHIIVLGGNAKTKFKVNSRHHQSVYRHTLDRTPINILATHATRSHHIEAINVSGYRVAAVQFHPEDLDEEEGVKYAVSLINSILKK
jgi:putative glutamine amidotransferase